MKIEEEVNACSVDELQPDRNVIDEDMMQNVDESKGHDRATNTTRERERHL